MKSIVEADSELDPETNEFTVPEAERNYDLLQKQPLFMKNGQLRMFDSIGSKVIWINVDHISEGVEEIS